jgi:hypothetical protein
MPLKFHCICGQALIVSRRLAGRAVRCPKCDVKIKVPVSRATSAADRLDRESPPVPASKPKVEPAPPAESPDKVAEELSEAATAAALVRGCEPHPRDVAATQWLALGISAVALFGVVPAIFDIAAHLRVADSPGVAVWAYLSIWIALIQISYSVYLAQLPDWSSVWVATMVTLVFSVAYAMLLGLTYLSRPEGWLAKTLEISDHLAGGRAAGWCFIMLCLTSLLSYLSGRVSVRWYQAISS